MWSFLHEFNVLLFGFGIQLEGYTDEDFIYTTRQG